jgi:hypothetical protein
MATEVRKGWVRRTIGRVIPPDDRPTRPDHAVFIRPDYSMCCEWHERHAFLPSPESLEVVLQRYSWRL